jgi:NitT/TauT family transport system substrate-binding protein
VPSILRPAIALLATLAVLIGGSAPAASRDSDLTSVKVGVIPITDIAPLYLGTRKGFFEAAGLAIQPTVLQTGPANIAALINGSLDIGFTASIPLLVAETKSVPVKIVAGATLVSPVPGRSAGQVMVKANSSIRSPRDLKGKTVAVNALKAIDHLDTSAYLDDHGVDPQSVKFTEVPFPDMAAALDRGRVDAAVMGEPFYSAALAQGFRSLFNPLPALGAHGQIAMWITSSDTATKRLSMLIAFARAWKRSVAYANAHQSEARAVLTSYTDLTAGQAQAVRLPWWSSGLNVVSMNKEAQLIVKYGFAPDLANPRALLVPQLIRALGGPVVKRK